MIKIKQITKLNQKHKGKFIKRQGLNVSVNELRELADDLASETRKFNLELGVEDIIDFDKKWLVGIVNKTGSSDGWTIE